jgi:FkbH-like protein
MSDPFAETVFRQFKERFASAYHAADFYGAQRAAADLLAQNASGRALRLIARAVKQEGSILAGLKPAKIAVLSSYSSEFLHDALIAALFLRGVAATLYQPGFSQFRQEILDSRSGLYGFGPDAVLLSVLGEDLCPSIYDGIPSDGIAQADEAAAELEGLIDAFRSRSSAPLLVQNLLPPLFPFFGVGDANLLAGQREQIHRFNARLAAACREHPAVYVIDYEALVARHGALSWHDERMRHFARLPIDKRRFLPLAGEYAKVINILKGGAKKCIVLDLDNTLWGGIIGEDGIDGIHLGPTYPGSAYRAFQKALRALNDRGVLLAIASKNNPADVEEVFENHPCMVLTRGDFAAAQVGWQPKSQMLETIADELGIALEHMVLIDDSPVECAEVARALPMVRTLLFPRQPERFASLLADEGLFDALQFSKEDRNRVRLYKQRAAAENLRSHTANLEDFYRSLDMEIIVEPVNAASLARTAQLTQKTNQLNLTTYRYTEADIAARMRDPLWHCWTVVVRDRFGDNGIIGVIMAQHAGGRLILDTFLMSCRVIGRTVETAMLAHLCDLAERLGIPILEASLIPTPKNLPVRSLLPDHDFERVGEHDGASIWHLDITTRRVQRPQWFRAPAAVCAAASATA